MWLVIANGGTGQRFGTGAAKQYSQVAGQTLFEWTLSQFLARSDMAGIVVSSHPDDLQVCTQSGINDPRITLVHGGPERSQSVLNALDVLANAAQDTDWILVHDVARPLIKSADIDALLHQVRSSGYGAILACPIADTIKRVDVDKQVVETVDRTSLWAAQTPQCFAFGLLRAALKDAQQKALPVTDEASAMEFSGHPVGIVAGSRSNIKVTYQEDLAFVAAQLGAETE